MDRVELFIAGAGAAGLAAAVSAWDSGVKKILLADRGEVPGGVLPQCIHEGFGLSTYGRELTGPEYAAKLQKELDRTGAELSLGTTVLSVSKARRAVLSGRSGLREIEFERMILATGCRENNLYSLPVSGTRPAGIFTAGQAQELINIHSLDVGDNVLILGSGDLGAIMARRFTLEGKRVVAVVEKEARPGAMARNIRRCFDAYAIPLVLDTELVRIHGEGRIKGVTLRHKDAGEEYIPCDTLVTALGLTPERSLIKNLGEPDWLSLCGNCSRVHDIVDSAVEEARRVGKMTGGTKYA